MAKAGLRLVLLAALSAAPLGCGQGGSAGGQMGGWPGFTWPWAKQTPKKPAEAVAPDPFAADEDKTTALQKAPDKAFQVSSMQDGVEPGVFQPSEKAERNEGKGKSFLWPQTKSKAALMPDPDRPAVSSKRSDWGEAGLFSKAGKEAAAGPKPPPDPKEVEVEFHGRRTPWGLSKGSPRPKALAGQTLSPDPKAAPGGNWKAISATGEGGIFYPKAGTLLPPAEGSQSAKPSWLDSLGAAFKRMFGQGKSAETQTGSYPPVQPGK